jgi:hypothetical protein
MPAKQLRNEDKLRRGTKMGDWVESFLESLVAKDYKKAVAELKNGGLDDQMVSIIGQAFLDHAAVLRQNNEFEFFYDILEAAIALNPEFESQEGREAIRQLKEKRLRDKLTEVIRAVGNQINQIINSL